MTFWRGFFLPKMTRKTIILKKVINSLKHRKFASIRVRFFYGYLHRYRYCIYDYLNGNNFFACFSRLGGVKVSYLKL